MRGALAVGFPAERSSGKLPARLVVAGRGGQVGGGFDAWGPAPRLPAREWRLSPLSGRGKRSPGAPRGDPARQRGARPRRRGRGRCWPLGVAAGPVRGCGGRVPEFLWRRTAPLSRCVPRSRGWEGFLPVSSLILTA